MFDLLSLTLSVPFCLTLSQSFRALSIYPWAAFWLTLSVFPSPFFDSVSTLAIWLSFSLGFHVHLPLWDSLLRPKNPGLGVSLGLTYV